MKMAFSVLEILSIILCNVIGLIMGIIGCIYASKSGKAYNEGRKEDFKDANKTTNIVLWIGLASVILVVISWIVIFATGVSLAKEIESEINNEYEYDITDDDYDFDEYFPDDNEDQIIGEADGEQSQSIPNANIGKWYSFVLNGQTLTLPMSLDEFKVTGFDIDEAIYSDTLEPGEYTYYMYYDENGNYIGWIDIANFGDTTITAAEGTVFEVDIDSTAPMVQFVGGLDFNSTEEEVLAYFGEPDYEYHSDEEADYVSSEYTWYPDDADSYYCDIEIDFWNGEMDTIYIEYDAGLSNR